MLPRQVKIVSAPRLRALQHIPRHFPPDLSLLTRHPEHHYSLGSGCGTQHLTLQQLWSCGMEHLSQRNAPACSSAGGCDSWAQHSSPTLTWNGFPGPAHSAEAKAALTWIQISAVLQPLFSLWNSYYLCVLSRQKHPQHIPVLPAFLPFSWLWYSIFKTWHQTCLLF